MLINKTFSGLLLSLLTSLSIFAQSPFSIQGKLHDKQAPVEFANVLLYAQSDTVKLLKSAVSDSLGQFKLTASNGNYLIKFQMMGYEPKRIAFRVQENTDLGTTMLTEDNRLLASVEVVSQKELVQKTTQGFIIKAKDNLTQAGGSATDLLKSVPTVVVDADGAITVRGKGPLILINGRTSGISSTDLIPASSVESVEIINNPSAQYDADSEGGIINIKLKKVTTGGTNAMASIGGGMGAKARGSSAFSINHQSGKWNIGLNYDMKYSERTRQATTNRTSFDQPLNYLLTQGRQDNRTEQTQNLKLNIDYAASDRDVINLEFIGNLEGQDNDETLTSRFASQWGSFTSRNRRESFEVEKALVGEFAITYAHQFASKGEKIVWNASTSIGKENQDTDIITNAQNESGSALGIPFMQRTYSYQKPQTTNLKVDYVKPLSEKVKLETGYKGIIRSTNIDYQNQTLLRGNYVKNAALSNVFDFQEQVHAAYVQIKSEPSKAWKYDIGLRAEQVNNSGSSVSNSSISFQRNYFNLFPTANLAYFINPSDFVKFSYSRRINRPGLGELNPMMDITDSLNQHGGNPYLKPELVHVMELGYDKEGDGWSLSSSAFFRLSNNVIRTVIEMKPNGVAITTPQNIGNASTVGIEEIFNWFPTKFWSVNTSVSLFNQKLSGNAGNTDVANDVFSWYTKVVNNFNLSKNTKLQVFGAYNAPTAMAQGTRKAVYNVDLGFQTKILHGKGGLGIVLSDVFNMQSTGWNISAPSDFNLVRTMKVDTRSVFITFAYSFANIFKESLLENQFSND
ncbi:TonB-dependent receptor domain-containing protein [Aquirufa echingensis]|uniref:TonB-dependent receptor n=1 Tax=Aquirufa echingensis TaxID=3096516 RepID=A0ABW6CY35_9BACT